MMLWATWRATRVTIAAILGVLVGQSNDLIAAKTVETPIVVFRTLQLRGGKLHGFAVSGHTKDLIDELKHTGFSEGGETQTYNDVAQVEEAIMAAGHARVPFDVNVRVKKGLLRWYDRVIEADEMYARKEYARAYHTFDEVIAMPEFPVRHRPAVLLSAARTLAAQNRDLHAQQLVSAALEDNPIPEVKENIKFFTGLCAARAGRWIEARNIYEHIVAQNPRHTDALNHLAMILFITGDLDGFRDVFLKFIQEQSAVAEKRQHQFFQNINHSYQSSFRKDRLGQDMGSWLATHIMHSLTLDGAPSRLSLAALSSKDSALEGYMPGALEANCVLVYSAYTRTVIAGTQFEADDAELNRGLLHFNVAQRLRKLGAWEQAAWHLQFVAQLGDVHRRGALMLHAAIQSNRIHFSESLRNREMEASHHRLTVLAANESLKSKDNAWHFLTLSAGLDLSQSMLSKEHLYKAITSTCDLTIDNGEIVGLSKAHVDDDISKTNVKKILVGVFCSEYYNSTIGRLLVPLLRKLQWYKSDIDIVLLSWPAQPMRRYLVDPSAVLSLNPHSIKKSILTIQRAKLEKIIFVDAMKDLRALTLSMVPEIASLVHHWELDRLGGTFSGIPFELRVPFYINLLKDLWNWSTPPEQTLPKSSQAVQGQLFFAKEQYFLVAGDASNLAPEFDVVIEELHVLHPSAVVILLNGESDECVSRASLWRRLARHKIDLARVKMLSGLSRQTYLAFLRDIVDVVIEPIDARADALLVALESLRLEVPVVAQGLNSSWSGSILNALGLKHLALAGTPKDLAKLAFALAGSISEDRSTYLEILGLRMRDRTLGNWPQDGNITLNEILFSIM
mmetsp:Transcript_19402/g.38043  ORF Transcript_19402/g.38043 Transcript_19402/m.38043 type:complete len:847 (-) Transcript_19402:128-2668(-)